MVRNAWELEQHAHHVRQQAMDAARQARLLALAGVNDGARPRDGAGAVVAEVVAGWLEAGATRLRRAAMARRMEPALTGCRPDAASHGC